MPAWLFPSLRGYRRQWLRGDALAACAVWAVLVPETLAYASIAGVSPVVGLYASPGALILYAAFGSSRTLITGTGAAVSALSAATVAGFAATGSHDYVLMTAALAISAGSIALLAAVLRLGFFASFVSQPVLKGFVTGLALTIIIGQLPKLLGVRAASGDFFVKAWELIARLGDSHGLTVLLGVGTLALVLTLRRLAPLVPSALVAVALGIALVAIFGLQHHGVATVGHITRGLPPLGLPDVGFTSFLRLGGAGVGVMLVGFVEGLSAAKTYAAREGYEVDTDRELIANGTANLAAGLSGGLVVSGSLTKTAVGGAAGAKTQLTGLITAALSVLTLFVLIGPFEDLPYTTLAAVVVAVMLGFVDFGGFVRLYRVYTKGLGREYGVTARPDFIAALAALLGVIVFDTLPGLYIGIGSSLMLLLYRASRPRVSELGKVPGTQSQYADIQRHPENEPPPGVAILRIETALFFANADLIARRVREAASRPGVKAVVLDAETVPYIDVTAVGVLEQTVRGLEAQGVRLLVARDIGPVRDVLREAGAGRELTTVYPSVELAVQAAEGAIAPKSDA